MRLRHSKGICVALSLLLLSGTTPSWASTKISAGTSCKKQSQQLSYKGKMYICSKLGSKLKWKIVSNTKKTTPDMGSNQAPKTNEVITRPSASSLVPGLLMAKYVGYHDDKVNWFESKDAASTLITNVIDLQTGEGDIFSIQWTGYFIPNETGKWKIATISDDGSNLWLGRSAIDSTPSGVSLISAPGIHGPWQREKEVSLEKGRLYPIRIQFGDATNWAQMTLFYRSPGSQISKTDLSGLVWHSPVSSEKFSGIDSQYASERILSTSTSNSTKLPILTSAASMQNLAECKLKNIAPSNINGRGFPTPSSRLATKGVIRGVMVFVDFPDVSGSGDLANRFNLFTNRFTDFYKAQSYGSLQIEMNYVPKYFRIPRNSADYGMQIHNAGNPWMYLKDALFITDAEVDYSNYDFVVVVPPEAIPTIVYGPAFPVAPGDTQLRTNEKIFHNATVAGSDSGEKNGKAWFWLAHEVGHLFGLEHQYTWSNITYESKLQGIWDLMNTGEQAPGLLAWHRFVLNWLDGETAQCIVVANALEIETTHFVAPIESQKTENKALFIKLNEFELLAVEVRRNLGFDSISEFEEGVIVYKVNVRDLQNDQEVLLLTQTPQPYGALIVGNLISGESVSYGGVEIKVLQSGPDGDFVQVRTVD